MVKSSLLKSQLKSNRGFAWQCRDGNVITIKSMSDGHIIASLNKCIREKWRTFAIPYFLDELKSRGFDKTHPELFI